MSDKKVEELIDIALQEETTDEFQKMDSVQEFFLDINLTPDEKDKADSQSIYWVYQKWCIQNEKEFVNRFKFFKQLRMKAKFMYSRGTTFVYVKSEPFNLSQDEWLLMRRAYRKETNDAVKRARRVKEKKKSD